MTKLKGAAILGAITVAGVMLVSSFPASSATSGLLISVRRLKNACGTTGDVNPVFAPVCNFVAALTARLVDLGLNPGDPIPSDVAEKALRTLRSPIKRILKGGCCRGLDRCDRCVQAVTEIETFLATNGTALAFQDTFVSACDSTFPDQPTRDECALQVAANVPSLIDNFLTDFPPLTACQNAALRACQSPSGAFLE